MSGYKEPITINLTCSPRELRELADRCEERATHANWGETTFVDFMFYSSEVVVKLFYDQQHTKGSPNFVRP